MSPSGSRKTSFIEILVNKVRNSNVSGKVLLNGLVSTGDDIKELYGAIYQNDIFEEIMVVREAIEMSAILRLPKLSTTRGACEGLMMLLICWT